MKQKQRFLTRSNLRDLVIILSFASSMFYLQNATIVAIGFVMLAIGGFVHVLAKGVLIRNVVLCDRGIYSVIRHPYYLANYLVDYSFCMLSGNPYLLALYPFLFFWAYGPTMRGEEAFLASRHGDSFRESSFAIPQVFPDNDSLKCLKGVFEGFSFRRISVKECVRITRFCSTGFAIMLVHSVNIRHLDLLFRPTKDNYDEFSFMVLTVAFLLVSTILGIVERGSRNGRAPACGG